MDLEGGDELWEGMWKKGLIDERKESEEASDREGFEDTHIVRLEQDMVACGNSKKMKKLSVWYCILGFGW